MMLVGMCKAQGPIHNTAQTKGNNKMPHLPELGKQRLMTQATHLAWCLTYAVTAAWRPTCNVNAYSDEEFPCSKSIDQVV